VDIREFLEARIFIADKIVDTFDQCLKLIGAPAVELTGSLHDGFIEECRKELAEIRSPTAGRLYVLAKATQLIHLCIAEYTAVIECSEMTGYCGVRVLLETCRADDTSFILIIKRLMRNIAEGSGTASSATQTHTERLTEMGDLEPILTLKVNKE
jgi:hypothetical protein